MDQDRNVNFNLNANDNLSPTLEQVARAWEEVSRAEQQAIQEINRLSEQFDSRFKKTASGAFQDIQNNMHWATDQARAFQAEIARAEEKLRALQERSNQLGQQRQEMAAADPIEASRVRGALSTDYTLYKRVRTNEEIAADKEAHAAAIQRFEDEHAEALALRALGDSANAARTPIRELQDSLEVLDYYLQHASPGDHYNTLLQRIQETRAEIQALGGELDRASQMRDEVSADYPGMDPDEAMRRALRQEAQFAANQDLRRQTLLQDQQAQEQLEASRALYEQRVAQAQEEQARKATQLDEQRLQQAVFNRQKEVDAVLAALERETQATEQAANRQAEIDNRRAQQAEQAYQRLADAYTVAQRRAQEAISRADAEPSVGTTRTAASASGAEESAARRLREQAERAAQQQLEVVERAYAAEGDAVAAYVSRVQLADAELEASAERVARARVTAAQEATTRAEATYAEQAARATQAAEIEEAAARQTTEQKIRYFREQDEAHAQMIQRQQDRENRYNLMGQFGHAIINTALYTTAFGLIMQVQEAAQGLVAAMFQKPAEAESAIAVYTRYLGSATEAQARYNAVMEESKRVGIPAQQILELDTRLAQLGVTAQTSQERFGRSVEQVLKDLEDLSAAPGIEPTQVMEFFTRASDGANRLLLSLKSAGVATEQELRSLGVRMNAQGTQILSDSDTTTRALLSVIERHYSGLAEATGKTAQGMQVRWANTWDQIARTFGEKSGIFQEVEGRQRKMLDAFDDPKTMQSISTLARNIGDLVSLELIAFDVVTKTLSDMNREVEKSGTLLHTVDEALRLMTGHPTFETLKEQIDAPTQALERLLGLTQQAGGGINVGSSGIDSSALSMDNLHAKIEAYRQAMYGATTATDIYGQTGQQSFDATTRAAEANRIAIDDLKNHLDDLNRAMRDSKRAEEDALAPLEGTRDYLQGVQEVIDKGYDKQAKTIQDHITAVQNAARESQEQYERQLDPLQRHLQQLQRDADATRTKYEGLIQPQQDHLKQLQRDADAVRQAYEDIVKPLKDQEEQLQRNYEASRRIRDLDQLNAKIAFTETLAQDIYSDQGRSAAEQLPDLYNQRQDLQDQMAYEAQKQSLEDRVAQAEADRDAALRRIDLDTQSTQDRVAALEKERDNILANNKLEQQTTQDQIQHIQDREKADADAFKREQERWQAQLDTIQKSKDAFDESVTTMIDAISGQIKVIQGEYDRQQKGIQREIDDTNDQIDKLEQAMSGALTSTQTLAQQVASQVTAAIDGINDAIDRWKQSVPTGKTNTGGSFGPDLGAPTGPDRDSRPPPAPTGKTNTGGSFGPDLGTSPNPPLPTPQPQSSGARRESVSLGSAAAAAAARGNQTVASSASTLTIQFIARDPNGKEWFRDQFDANIDWASKRLAKTMRKA